jgi:hypothetical protein
MVRCEVIMTSDEGDELYTVISRWRAGVADEQGTVALRIVDRTGAVHRIAMSSGDAERMSTRLAIVAHEARSRTSGSPHRSS